MSALPTCLQRMQQWWIRSRHKADPEDQPLSDLSDSLSKRHHACSELSTNAIAYAIWLEDLLVHHGSDTLVNDFNLLVDDPDEAAHHLLRSGYVNAARNPMFDFVPEKFTGIQLRSPLDETVVNLLRASTWKYNHKLERFPPLSHFVDAMMAVWLDIPVVDYSSQILFGLYIFCLIAYPYWLKDSGGIPVKSVEYAEFLAPEHRELHFDIIEDSKKRKALSKPRTQAQFQSSLPGLTE